MKAFYEPNQEQLVRLEEPWICSYSGGKDSTSLVTWLEYLRRVGWINPSHPRLVLSDTGVEYPSLQLTTELMMKLLTAHGWECAVVRPAIKEKLYNQIFGRGVPPIHPGIRSMRWCTRATKIAPMMRYRQGISSSGLLALTGSRWGESKVRDERLLNAGCQVGGECGTNAVQENKYSPIVNWTTCQVIDWLSGHTLAKKHMGDMLEITARLIDIYNVKIGPKGLGIAPPKVSALRFGCIGCPAISSDKTIEEAIRKQKTKWKPLRRLYFLWHQLRKPENRLPPRQEGKKPGPIRMAARQKYFPELLKIQEEAGVTLVDEQDIAFIKKCWEDKVYPRGWSAEDE